MKVNILIGGKAGDGLNTLLDVLTRSYSQKGLYMHTYKDYMSRVRGGHNFIQILVSDKPQYSHSEQIDIMFAYDEETYNNHKNRLNENSVIICSDKLIIADDRKISMDFTSILAQSHNPRGKSMIGYGAITKILGLDRSVIENYTSKKWAQDVAEKNTSSALISYDLLQNKYNFTTTDKKLKYIGGNEAIAMGAATAGVKFYFAYPMAPSTSVMNYLYNYSHELGIVIEQAEDEIAAINGVIGSSSTGVRSMTGSSGGGICLMGEGIGFAGIAEVPVVVIDVQRPGPATGLATRTEQSDLNFITNISHGEYPKAVIAVSSPEDAFYKAFKAFNLADKFRIPVIILSDQYLADSGITIDGFNFDSLKIEKHITTNTHGYLNHDLNNVLNERVLPGNGEITIMTDSHEHNEKGSITESPENRSRMMERRMSKIEMIRAELEEPEYIGPENPESLLVSFGSINGSLRKAYEELDNEKVGILLFTDVYPLPLEKISKYGRSVDKLISVEQNFTSQLATLIRKETGLKFYGHITKYDGRQMSSDYIISKLKEMI